MEMTTIETELKTAGASGRQGLYAGNDAWREWFEVCFVDGCATAAALREQVAPARRKAPMTTAGARSSSASSKRPNC